MKKILILFTAFFALQLSAAPHTFEEWRADAAERYSEYNAIKDIVYKTVDGEELQLDLILPDGKFYKDGFPVIFVFHGGGWVAGNRFMNFNEAKFKELEFYTSRGIGLVNVSYRFANPEKNLTVKDCVIDCFDAARFIVKNADKYGIDTSRMASYGHSVGGYMALMLAVAPNEKFKGDEELSKYNFKLKCAAPYSGLASFLNPADEDSNEFYKNRHNVKTVMGGKTPAENKELARSVSALYLMERDHSPLLVMHGELDDLSPCKTSELLFDKARSLGWGGEKMTLIIVKGGDHGLGVEAARPMREQGEAMRKDYILRFLLDGVKSIK